MVLLSAMRFVSVWSRMGAANSLSSSTSSSPSEPEPDPEEDDDPEPEEELCNAKVFLSIFIKVNTG